MELGNVLSGCDKGGWSCGPEHGTGGCERGGSGGVGRALVGDSAFASFDSIALQSMDGLECKHSLLSPRECALEIARSKVVPAFPSPVWRVGGGGVGEWLFKVGVRSRLCGDSRVSLRSGFVMVGVVEAWSNEGAIFMVRT